MAKPPLLMTTAPAARLAAISESTLRYWARAGLLPSQVTSTGVRLFTSEDVLRVARERVRRPREMPEGSAA